MPTPARVAGRSLDFKLKCLKTLPAGQAFLRPRRYGGPLNRRGDSLNAGTPAPTTGASSTSRKYLNTPFSYGVQPANGTTNAFVYASFFNNPCRPLFSFAGCDEISISFEAGDGQLDYFFSAAGRATRWQRLLTATRN